MEAPRNCGPREEGEGWEVAMDPPVNHILPVSRGRVEELVAAYG